jgi:hypothetical protein
MEPQPTKVSSFLSSLLPEVKTEVGFNTRETIQTAAIIFIAAVAIILAWFSLKKYLN